jgi:phospholipid transport system transporter-binding protein
MTSAPLWALETSSPGGPAGSLRLTGRISFDTAADVSSAVDGQLRALSAGQDCDLDLAGVTHADSAGLAVLVEALSLARARKIRLRLNSIPEPLRAIARISELDELLDRATEGAELVTEQGPETD